MSTVLPFGSNIITTFVYEPFSYTISNPNPGTYTLTTTKTSGIPSGYITNNGSNVVFATSSNGMNTGVEVFSVIAKDPSGVTISTSSNTVNVAAGRFLNGSGASYTGSNFTFFSKEPITPVRLVAPFAISTPTASPALPPGLSFTAISSNIYDITGTPFIQVPQSNYLFIGRATGSNIGKIITSQFALSISNERILVNLSGSPIVSPMIVNSAITPRVITSRYPPYPSGGVLQYVWNTLPDGIIVTDISGTTQPLGFFTPTDPSSTLIVKGTPTIAAANFFRDNGITSNVITFTAVRISPLPQLVGTVPLTFAFGETVLFDTPVIPTFYNGVTLDPSATFFRAQTYFGTASPISNIFSPNLRSDLSINFVSAQGRGYLTGTPTSTGTAAYTIRGINSNGISRDLSATISVVDDVVTFISPPTPAIDICYNFVVSRPASAPLTGYYPSPIQFYAVAASGKPITFSSSGITGTGLTLSNVSANVVQLSGVPDTITALTTATITASAVGTPASASRTFKLAVLNDVITISDSSFNFIQNRTIIPVQLTATTLSERDVTSFSSSNLPSGLTISTTGLISGAPTLFTVSPSNFTVNASTGYANQNKVYTYESIEDNAIIVLAETTQTVNPVFSGVDFRILTYSGAEGILTSNFGSNGLVPKQGINATLSVSSNLVSGNFSIVPVLAPEYRFQANGTVGSFTTNANVRIVVTNPPTVVQTAFLAESYTPVNNIISPAMMDVQIWQTTSSPISVGTDIFGQIQYSTPPSMNWYSPYSLSNMQGTGYDLAKSSNVYVAILGSNIIRSIDYGLTWSNIPSSNIERLSFVHSGPIWGAGGFPTEFRRFDNPIFSALTTDGTSNWYALGRATVGTGTPTISTVSFSILRQSTDNGITWSDISTNIPVSTTDLLPTYSNKLSYNQSRLFFTDQIKSNSCFYADTTDLTTWTLITPSRIAGIAFSNSTAFAVGADSTSAAKTFRSTDNGINWINGPDVIVGSGTGYEYGDVAYKYGQWVLAGIDNGSQALYASSDTTTWSNINTSPLAGILSAITENGISWLVSGFLQGGQDLIGTTWIADASLALAQPIVRNNFSNVVFQTKRLVSDSYSIGDPTLTFSLGYDASGIAFTGPVQTQYTNWQFVPISPITVTTSNPVPGTFMYYYASGLPRGLTFTPDPTGVDAVISGTSSQFSDAFQRVVLFAARGGGIAPQVISMRTILPTVQKQQTGAGSWTSLVRQYTVVNAAQNSVNGRGLPATESLLGEFTRPEPPDVVTQTKC